MRDNENILKAINGNKNAIKKVLNDYSESMYKMIFLHTKYEEDSKQILRDTMYFVENNITKLKSCDKFDLWLYKIIMINTNNFLQEIGMVENDINISDYYIDDKIDLYRGIDLVDGKYKSALILKYYFDFSDEDIGEILDLNENTVKIYIRQALKKIKSIVGEI